MAFPPIAFHQHRVEIFSLDLLLLEGFHLSRHVPKAMEPLSLELEK